MLCCVRAVFVCVSSVYCTPAGMALIISTLNVRKSCLHVVTDAYISFRLKPQSVDAVPARDVHAKLSLRFVY